jgi:hypothetical protein
MKKGMSADVAHHDPEDRDHLDHAARTGHGPAGAPFDPRGSSGGQLTDVLVSELLKTRGARPPNLESENECLHSLAQHLLTDPEHIVEQSIRAAARLCGAGSAGVSLLETDHGNEVFRWVALGGAFEGQEGRSTPRFFSPSGLAFDRQAPQLFSYPARYYTCLHGAVPEIVEALVLPLPDGTGTIWIVAHDEAVRFDGEHVRVLTGLATFMATSLRLLRLIHQAKRARGETERDQTAQHGGNVAAASPGMGFEYAFTMQLPLPLPVDPVERGAAKVPTLVPKRAGDDLVVEARDLARAEQQGGTPPVTGPSEMNEVFLAFRALIEQVRLVLRDSRRLIRRLIAVGETSTRSRRVQMTSSPAPLASVPLVVLRSTTEREQIELNEVVQSLSADGYQVARRGPQWVVYTEITDRRKSVIGLPQDRRETAAMSEQVRSGSLRQRRRDDRGIASAAPLWSQRGTVKLTRTGPDHPSMPGSQCLSAGTRHDVPHQEGAGS